jgi:cytochrome c
MNKFIFIISILLFMSCKKEENNSPENQTIDLTEKSVEKTETTVEFGKTLFEGEGNCSSCHQIEEKIIGPSIQEIAKIYKGKNASIVSFLREESGPIIDPSKYDIMKTNFAITEEMTDDQLKALEEYILSFSK